MNFEQAFLDAVCRTGRAYTQVPCCVIVPNYTPQTEDGSVTLEDDEFVHVYPFRPLTKDGPAKKLVCVCECDGMAACHNALGSTQLDALLPHGEPHKSAALCLSAVFGPSSAYLVCPSQMSSSTSASTPEPSTTCCNTPSWVDTYRLESCHALCPTRPAKMSSGFRCHQRNASRHPPPLPSSPPASISTPCANAGCLSCERTRPSSAARAGGSGQGGGAVGRVACRSRDFLAGRDFQDTR